ncbi:hypothetical protein LDENG_00192100 [Lucifuga dentata]|nr:hypothetical protein LDENG_00192100 [Lucifuga dentata]
MIVSNVTCMKIEYIRLQHAKWVVWSFNRLIFVSSTQNMDGAQENSMYLCSSLHTELSAKRFKITDIL